MCAFRVQRQLNIRDPGRANRDLALDPGNQRQRRDFVDINFQPVTLPRQATWSNGEAIIGLAKRCFAAIRHRKPPAAPIGGDVDAAMIGGVLSAAPAIPRRED